MKNIMLKIEYDGTNYCGWQRQVSDITIQGEIEKAIFKITSEKVDLIGSSRTDSGVHAKAMIANFLTNSNIPPESFKGAINSKLPDDIGIIDAKEVSLDFHARYMSKGKTYCYTIVNKRERVCIARDYCYHVRYKLDVGEMKDACRYFVGEHDFKAFRTVGSSVKTTVRTITDIHIDLEENDDEKIIKLYVTANGFLYNMVRIIVSTLIDVGRGKLKKQEIPDIIEKGERRLAGHVAPASGLTLMKVYY